MVNRHPLFDTFLNLVANGNSADEAKAVLSEAFPAYDPAFMDAILDNMGDLEKVERQYMNAQFVAARNRNAVTYELSDEAVTGRPAQNAEANAELRSRARGVLGTA